MHEGFPYTLLNKRRPGWSLAGSFPHGMIGADRIEQKGFSGTIGSWSICHVRRSVNQSLQMKLTGTLDT